MYLNLGTILWILSSLKATNSLPFSQNDTFKPIVQRRVTYSVVPVNGGPQTVTSDTTRTTAFSTSRQTESSLIQTNSIITQVIPVSQSSTTTTTTTTTTITTHFSSTETLSSKSQETISTSYLPSSTATTLTTPSPPPRVSHSWSPSLSSWLPAPSASSPSFSSPQSSYPVSSYFSTLSPTPCNSLSTLSYSRSIPATGAMTPSTAESVTPTPLPPLLPTHHPQNSTLFLTGRPQRPWKPRAFF